jgi:rod shape-determining protein MreC
MTAVRPRPTRTPRPPHAPRRRRRRLRIAALVATALVLITVDFRGSNGVVGSARDTTLEVLAPVRRLGGVVTGPFRAAWRGITDYEDLADENARLRDQLAAAEQDVLGAGELQRELDALIAENGLDIARQVRQVVARVIQAPVSSFERTIELDRGSDDGIRVGMPVVSGGGLLGQVAQVSPSRSRVQVITDPDMSVGVRMVRSGDVGATRGQGPDRPLQVDLISLETPVLPGESVVTSGIQGSRYPEGLLVGTVVDVDPVPVANLQTVLVRPAARADGLRFATVLLFTPEPVPTTTTTTPSTTSTSSPGSTAVPDTTGTPTTAATSGSVADPPTATGFGTLTDPDGNGAADTVPTGDEPFAPTTTQTQGTRP